MRGHTALLAHSTGVRDDYVSAKINTRIYMGLMGEIAILSTSL